MKKLTSVTVTAAISGFFLFISTVLYVVVGGNAIFYNISKISIGSSELLFYGLNLKHCNLLGIFLTVLPMISGVCAVIFIILFAVKRKRLFYFWALGIAVAGGIAYLLIPSQMLPVAYYITYRFFFSINLIDLIQKFPPYCLPDQAAYYAGLAFIGVSGLLALKVKKARVNNENL